MKDEWGAYLESIGIKELFLKRAEEVINFYQQIYQDQIEDIFVTEYLKEDGERVYESLFLFSKSLIMEAKQFLTVDDFDCVPFENNIRYWVIKKKEYNFLKALNKSRMTVEFAVSGGSSATLKASQGNCDHLKALFLKHIISNLVKRLDPSH